MDPLQPLTNQQNPENPVVASNTEPTGQTEQSPTRILDIIREAAVEKAAAAETYRAPTPPPPATPQAVTPAPEHIPSLAELGGTIGTIQGPTTTMEEISKVPKPLITPISPQPEMEVYKPSPLPDMPRAETDSPAQDTTTSPLAEIKMSSIKLEAEEPKAPHTFSTSLTPEPTPTEDVPVPAAKGTPGFIIPSVHTLRDDMKSVVRDQSMSIVRASALEEDRRQARAKVVENSRGTTTTPTRKRGGMGIIIAIIIFLVLGSATGAGFWWYRTVKQTPLTIKIDESSTIFAEQSVSFSLSNSSPSVLKRSLGSTRTGGAASPGAITRLIPTASTDTSIGGKATTHLANASEFFSAIGAQLPTELASAIGPDIFLGIHSTDGNQALIIVPVTSYEHAFAGMLTWEASMGDNLSPFFEAAPTSITASDGSAIANTFKDIVIKNYDVRLQSDASGNPKLMYSFPNRDFLIITSSPYTFIEALARLQAARKL